MRSFPKTLSAVPFSILALALVHCSAPENGAAAGNESPAAEQDVVSARSLSAQEIEDKAFCRGKTGDIFPVTFCKPGGVLGKANRLIQCIPGSQRGAPGDPGDSTSSIACINGCTNAGLAHCLSEAELAETKFCVGKVGDLFPTVQCMKTPGAKDKLVECIPGSQRGEPTDPGDSARSVECISGCSETSRGVATCNGTPQ